MPYSTPAGVRTLLDIDSAEASDTALQPFCDYAGKALLSYITIMHRDEQLKGDINGINKEYWCEHIPIADSDMDKDVDTADITVYTWTDATDEDTKTQVTVSSINPLTGRIVLASAPSTNVEIVTIDYRSYTVEVDWDLITLAANQYAAYLYLQSQYIMEGDTTKIGAVSKAFRGRMPFERMFDAFTKTMRLIRRKPFRIFELKKKFKELSEEVSN